MVPPFVGAGRCQNHDRHCVAGGDDEIEQVLSTREGEVDDDVFADDGHGEDDSNDGCAGGTDDQVHLHEE